MKVDIHYLNTPTPASSLALKELSEHIKQDCKADVSIDVKPTAGIKDGGLAIGIAIASLALSGISTLITALVFWQSQHPRYSISFRSESVGFTFRGLSKPRSKALLDKLRELPNIDHLNIEISE